MAQAISKPNLFPYNTPDMFPAEFVLHAPTCLWRWNSVPKRWHIKFRRRGITQKKAYNINTWTLKKKTIEKIQISLNRKRIKGNLHEDQYTFFIISGSILLRMRNISDKHYIEIKTHFRFRFFFFNLSLCEIMWKNIVEPDKPKTTTWRMRIACWIPKATNAHSEYVILFAFLLQQWLQ